MLKIGFTATAVELLTAMYFLSVRLRIGFRGKWASFLV
jgi:hypothetical protein